MKTQLKMTLIASAVAALVSGPVMASDDHGGGKHGGGHNNVHMKMKIDVDKNIDVDKTVDVEKNYTVNTTRNEIDHIDRELRDIVINASAGASARDTQFIHANEVENVKLTNDAS
ncbi:MAG: hypothetical protein ACQES3_07000, partial [Pseudomonadota bacterium]